MNGSLSDNLKWLGDQRHAHMTQVVTYCRAEAAVAWTATLGRTAVEGRDEYGAVIRIESQDFIGRASELRLNGAPVTPVPGDRVRVTVDGQVRVYEVTSQSPDPPWQYADPYCRTLRIHTKFVGTE